MRPWLLLLYFSPKVTPAHDPNDFATGKRHNLPSINVFNEASECGENSPLSLLFAIAPPLPHETLPRPVPNFVQDGYINDAGGQFSGMKRFDARVAVVDALKAKGLFRGLSDNAMRLGFCSRSKASLVSFCF